MKTIFPNIKGLTTRFLTNDHDYDALVSVQQKRKEYDAVDEISTLESIPSVEELKETITYDHCDPQKDVLLVEIQGEVIGYARVAWWVETDDTWLFLHNEYLIPQWRGKGIDDAMLQWAEERIREIAIEEKASGTLMFGTNATDSEKEKTALILKNGYQQVFSQIEMELSDLREVKPIEIPEGFVLKEVLPEHLRKIWEANNEVYAGRAFTEVPTEEDFEDFKEDPRNDYSLWSVAWHEDEVAGLVLGQIEKGRGEITEVSVLGKYRRKGLAQALMLETLFHLQQKGVSLVRLHTSGENVAGAKTLYEKVGFRLLKTYIRYRKAFML